MSYVKSFKMPKVYSETVNQRTDNTMPERKYIRDNQRSIEDTSHYREVKIEQLEPTQNLGWILEGYSSCYNSGSSRITLSITSDDESLHERGRLWYYGTLNIHCSLWHRYSTCHDSDRKNFEAWFPWDQQPSMKKIQTCTHEYNKCEIYTHMQRLLENSYKR